MSVAIMYKGEIVFAQGFGKRNLKDPFTKEVHIKQQQQQQKCNCNSSISFISFDDKLNFVLTVFFFAAKTCLLLVDCVTYRIGDKGIYCDSNWRAGCRRKSGLG